MDRRSKSNLSYSSFNIFKTKKSQISSDLAEQFRSKVYLVEKLISGIRIGGIVVAGVTFITTLVFFFVYFKEKRERERGRVYETLNDSPPEETKSLFPICCAT